MIMVTIIFLLYFTINILIIIHDLPSGEPTWQWQIPISYGKPWKTSYFYSRLIDYEILHQTKSFRPSCRAQPTADGARHRHAFAVASQRGAMGSNDQPAVVTARNIAVSNGRSLWLITQW